VSIEFESTPAYRGFGEAMLHRRFRPAPLTAENAHTRQRQQFLASSESGSEQSRGRYGFEAEIRSEPPLNADLKFVNSRHFPSRPGPNHSGERAFG